MEEKEWQIVFAIYKKEEFYIKNFEKNIVENNPVKCQVIRHFFFCNKEQICFAR